jgi:hypothetical protein
MTDRDASPAKPSSLPRNVSSSSLRMPGLKSFLPLSAEPNSFPTRGQHLPSLLSRRPSSIRADHRSSFAISDDEEDIESLKWGLATALDKDAERRMSMGAQVLKTPQMRSQRLIGNSNPRYKWERYFKTDDELKNMKKPVRQYYERNNYLIQNYMYIDRLLDSSLPHNLIQEYSHQESGNVNIPSTITEEASTPIATPDLLSPRVLGVDTPPLSATSHNGNGSQPNKVKRTPKNLYKVPDADEQTPLLEPEEDDEPDSPRISLPEWVPEEDEDTDSPIVKIALYMNLSANTVLLILKIIVAVMTSSLSVIASLVDAALDFLSTAIVGLTSWMIARQDQYAYPVGRRRLEPIGVLVRLHSNTSSGLPLTQAGLLRHHDNLLLPSSH